jgi:hypothetical protein
MLLKAFLVAGLVAVALSAVGSGAVMAQDDPEVPSTGEEIALQGTLQKTEDGTYILEGKFILQSQLDLEPYVGKEVVIRGKLIAEDPPTVEVLAIEEWVAEEPEEPYTPSVGDHIGVRGILQKTADGTYVIDEIVLLSSTIDLEPYVGQLVCAKGEVVAEAPLTIEVEAIQGHEYEPPEVPPQGSPLACLHGVLQKTAAGEYILENAEGRPSPISDIILRSSTIDLEEWVGKEVYLKGEVVSEDPLTIEVLGIKECEETGEPGIGEVPPESPQVMSGHGMLLKRDDGSYTLDDKIILRSRTIDLELWVGKEVIIKAEGTPIESEPTLEVLAICEWNSAASEAVTDGEESYDAETLRKMLGTTAVESSSWGEVKALFR